MDTTIYDLWMKPTSEKNLCTDSIKIYHEWLGRQVNQSLINEGKLWAIISLATAIFAYPVLSVVYGGKFVFSPVYDLYKKEKKTEDYILIMPLKAYNSWLDREISQNFSNESLLRKICTAVTPILAYPVLGSLALAGLFFKALHNYGPLQGKPSLPVDSDAFKFDDMARGRGWDRSYAQGPCNLHLPSDRSLDDEEIDDLARSNGYTRPYALGH